MKKFIAFLVIVVLLAGAAFYFGWLQFAVPADRLGVMVSKTGGVYPKIIARGIFSWRPERLLPTNAMIVTFSASPYSSTETVTGELPSGKIYGAWMQVPSPENPRVAQVDFSYTATITGAVRIKPERLPALYESGAAIDQSGLDIFLKQKCSEAARLACDALLARKTIDGAFVAGLSGNPAFSDVEVVSLHVESATIPDMELYEKARASYAAYRDRVNDALSSLARDHAVSTMRATAAMEQLEKLGILLQSYPQLAELFAKADSPAVIIREINSLFGQ
jgi:hypothetical protein